jgi:hypothetical protein
VNATVAMEGRSNAALFFGSGITGPIFQSFASDEIISFTPSGPLTRISRKPDLRLQP